MNLDTLRDYCLSFPDATENVQWGNDLVFKVGDKMFTVACLDPAETKLSFKCTPEEFAELIEQDGIRPADYVARYHWVTLVRWDALPDREVRRLVKDSYEMIRAKLPRPAPTTRKAKAARKTTARKPAKRQTSTVKRRKR